MNERQFFRLVLLLLIPIFWISKPIELIWDDQLLIGLNPWTENFQNISKIWFWNLWHDIPGEHSTSWFRPLMALHLIIDQQLFGDSLFPRQLVSLFWYLGLSGLVWKYLNTWQFSTLGKRLGFLFFVFHPFQLELIHFLAARNDIMVMVFSLAAILSQHKRSKITFFTLALLSKESAIILIPILLFGEFLKQENWKKTALIFKQSALLFGVITGLYFGWKQFISLPTQLPEIENLLPTTMLLLENIFLPWNTATAGFTQSGNLFVSGIILLLMVLSIPLIPSKKNFFFYLIFIIIFLLLGGLASITSHSLSYRYTTLPLLGFSLLISNLRLSHLSITKQQALFILLIGFLFTGFQNTYSQWKDSKAIWIQAHQQTPSSHSACGLFMQTQEEPNIALPLLDEATNNPPSQHCCFHASQYPLNTHSPQRSITLGKKALTQGCLVSPELMAPLALSEALLGNWKDAKDIATQLQTDPYGYSPLILTAEGLKRGDTTALDYWSKNDPIAKEQLRQKAEQFLEMTKP